MSVYYIEEKKSKDKNSGDVHGLRWHSLFKAVKVSQGGGGGREIVPLNDC